MSAPQYVVVIRPDDTHVVRVLGPYRSRANAAAVEARFMKLDDRRVATGRASLLPQLVTLESQADAHYDLRRETIEAEHAARARRSPVEASGAQGRHFVPIDETSAADDQIPEGSCWKPYREHVALIAPDGTVLDYARGASGPTRYGSELRQKDEARLRNAAMTNHRLRVRAIERRAAQFQRDAPGVSSLDPTPWVHRTTKLRTDNPAGWGHLMTGPNDDRAWKRDPRPEFDVGDNKILKAFAAAEPEGPRRGDPDIIGAWALACEQGRWDHHLADVDDAITMFARLIEHARPVLERIQKETSA